MPPEEGAELDLKKIRDLEATEVRVLGALLEKEQATPDHYPLTVNALLAACNQKSNRDPVTALSETEVVDSLETLREDVLVWRQDGARAERWSQSISRRLELDPEEKAVLTLLMLRGPQTAGELKGRSGRLHSFDAIGEVEAALERLGAADRALAVELPRQPGQKENRWMHLLGGPVEAGAAAPATARAVRADPARPGLSERVAALESQVSDLVSQLEALRQKLEP